MVTKIYLLTLVSKKMLLVFAAFSPRRRTDWYCFERRIHFCFDYTGPTGIYQSITTGTLEKFNANISVYPNPARGTATVEIKDAKVGNVLVINDPGQ